MEFLRLSGEKARPYDNEIANLRLKVFWEYPYLYEGSLEYEQKYLETYFKAQHSFIFLIKDGSKIVGATTSVLAQEEQEQFRKPFIDYGLDPSNVFYFGESVLLPEYRGKGYGKIFFEEREKFARSLRFIEILSFCAVTRENHPLEPQNYEPLNPFWESKGFKMAQGLTTQFEWPDRNEEHATVKTMQFWIKKI